MHSRPPKLDYYQAADGRRLIARVWDGNDSPRARVVFLHGITSHSGWYNRSCDHLRGAGFEVHFLDRRGSGLNPDDRGDIACWMTWVRDVAVYLEQLGNSRPVILCGISWGGKLAAAVARKHPGLIDGLGLLCPGIYSPHEPGMLKRLVLAAPVGERFEQRRVSIPLVDGELFTNTRKRIRFIERDPLALRDVTFRLAREDRKLSRFARDAAPFLRTPLLLVLAGRDRIVDNRRMRDFFARTASPNKTLLEYTSAAHTLEFEPDPAEYFADLSTWLGATAAT